MVNKQGEVNVTNITTRANLFDQSGVGASVVVTGLAMPCAADTMYAHR